MLASELMAEAMRLVTFSKKFPHHLRMLHGEIMANCVARKSSIVII